MSRMAAQEVTIVMGMAEERQTLFSVLVKRSYDILNGQPLARRDHADPFRTRDVYHEPGDPETCTILHEDELAPYKPATDIVFIAQAYAPEGRPVQTMTVGVEVAGQRKFLRITGDRLARHRPRGAPIVTEPVAFTTMPIRFERAYGGQDLRSRPDAPFHYPRNPLGRGVAILNNRETIEDLKLPNVEDPDDLLTPERIVLEDESRWNAQPLSHGLGWFQKTWYPRCSFVGAMPAYVSSDEVMREEGLGLVPAGQIGLARSFRLPAFDVRFNNGASPGLSMPVVPPGALIRLAHLSPGGMLSFTLPTEWPSIMLDIGLGSNVLPAALHTVSVRVDEQRVDMIWRGAHPYPGSDWLPEMRQLEVELL